MKRFWAGVLAAAALVLAPVSAAAVGPVYEDSELGFWLALPDGLEYYGDMLEQSMEVVDQMGAGEAAEAARPEKQPFYMGETDNINILYSRVTDMFDDAEKRLPDGMRRDEIDLYLLTEDKQTQLLEEAAAGLTGQFGLEVLSKELKDYGDKLCIAVKSRGFNEEYGVDLYQGSVAFLYKDYMVTITYFNFDVYGDLTAQNAFESFDASIDTLRFSVVPPDKTAKLKDAAGPLVLYILGAVVAGSAVAGIIVLLIRRRRNDEKRQLNQL